jgi:hypothetical protein
MGNLKKIFSGKWSIAILLLLIIGVNCLATIWHTRLDFTDEKRFTLSNHTIELLSHIQEPVHITVLLDGDLKSEFKKLSNSSKELLQNFKNYGGNNIQFTFEMPGEGLDDSAKALRLASISVLGREKKYLEYKDGELVGEVVRQEKNEALHNIFMDVRHSCFYMMWEISELLGEDFFCWKTDCIYYRDTPENRKIVHNYLEEREMLFKQLVFSDLEETQETE